MTGAEYAEVVRAVAATAHRYRLTVPAFKAPAPNGRRTIRRDGIRSVVSITIADRPQRDVFDDVVDGLLAVNDLTPEQAPDFMEAVRHVADD